MTLDFTPQLNKTSLTTWSWSKNTAPTTEEASSRTLASSISSLNDDSTQSGLLDNLSIVDSKSNVSVSTRQSSISSTHPLDEPIYFPTGITGRLMEARGVLDTLRSRLKAHLENQARWDHGDQNVPIGFQVSKGCVIHPVDALNPCPVVNQALTQLVESVCLTPASQTEVDGVIGSLSTQELDHLRSLSMFSEERLEKSALNLLFAIHPNNSVSTQHAHAITQLSQKLMAQDSTLSEDMAKLKALIVKHPEQELKRNPNLPGQPFIYLDNYIKIVEAELQLLTKPLPDNRPALFSIEALSQQHFAFVGAGFPLTALALHLKTGAKITLIDRDGEAIRNANKLLQICDDLGLLDRSNISLVHRDALDCAFISPDCAQNSNLNLDGKLPINVNILDLASALPTAVTKRVINGNTSKDIFIRKRNVSGMSKMLYQPYKHDETTSPYYTVAQVIPPSYPRTDKEDDSTIGLTSECNINSCALLLPKDM